MEEGERSDSRDGGGGRVAFRSCVSVVEEKVDGEGRKTTSFDVQHKPVDETTPKFERKQVRKATGYQKRTPQLALDEEEEDDDEEEIASATTTARSSTPTGAQSDKEEGGPFTDGHEEVTRRSSMKHEDKHKLSGWCCGLCPGTVDAGEAIYTSVGLPLRRQSSVGIGKVEEIDDAEGDKHWHDEPRHETRWQRIRNRIPTGNPKLMKATSSELLQIIDVDVQ
eukprot:GHVS01027907.1.p1 GENE.GHVS01027907.1~~GHVS01027907.1.p1  ORF type:complete len:223 (+),score=49.73 GHVS01027907.1:239-907(+)